MINLHINNDSNKVNCICGCISSQSEKHDVTWNVGQFIQTPSNIHYKNKQKQIMQTLQDIYYKNKQKQMVPINYNYTNAHTINQQM